MQEQEQRIKNNILIAKFMDLDWELFLPSRNVNYLVNGNYYEAHELSYNISWDWLMPVVNKCLNIYHIEQMNDDLSFKFYDSMGDIKKTYKAVLEFIKDENN